MATTQGQTKAAAFDPHDYDAVVRSVNKYTELSTKMKDIHDSMTKNFNMVVSSMQIPEAVRTKLESQERPILAYNLISPVIKGISSIQKGNRKKLTVIGVTENDYDKAEVMSKTLNFFLNKSRADYHFSRAFIDAIIAKWGVIRSGWSFKNDPMGRFSASAINPMRILFDMDFSDITMEDCSLVQDVNQLSFEDIMWQYALNNPELQDAILSEAKNFFVEDTEKSRKFISQRFRELFQAVSDTFILSGASDQYNTYLRTAPEKWFNEVTGKFTCIETHERRTERRMLALDVRSGKPVDITERVLSPDGYREDRELVQRAIKELPFITEPAWGLNEQIWITTTCPGLKLKLYDAPYEIQNGNFMFTPVFAFDFHRDKALTQSVVDELIDPQSEYNKSRSTMLEMIVRFVSRGYVVEGDAIEDYLDDWENPKIGGYKRISDINKFKTEPEINPNQGLWMYANESKQLFDEISGWNRAARGREESSNEPAKAYIAKRDQSIQMLQHLFDNQDQSQLIVGNNGISYIQKFCTEQRILRITEDVDKPETLTINQRIKILDRGRIIEQVLNDVTVGEFDCQISHAPYGVNAREMDFLKLNMIYREAKELDKGIALKLFPVFVKASDSAYRTEILQELQGIQQMQGEQAKIQATDEMMRQLMQKLELLSKKAEIDGKTISNRKQKQEMKATTLSNIRDVQQQQLLQQLIGG